jgi:preprotein translocase subunit SecG
MGGGASTDTFLGGRQAATILTKATWWMGGVFLGLSLILAGLSTRSSQPTSVLDAMPVAPTPIAPAQDQPQLPIEVEPAEPAETPPQN